MNRNENCGETPRCLPNRRDERVQGMEGPEMRHVVNERHRVHQLKEHRPQQKPDGDS